MEVAITLSVDKRVEGAITLSNDKRVEGAIALSRCACGERNNPITLTLKGHEVCGGRYNPIHGSVWRAL